MALDKTGAVVVVEVKRAVDRSQLAQCLEYAGWARTTNLDEIAGFYHRSATGFWSDWIEFTETDQPVVVNRNPRLIVVARSFDERTESAMAFLRQNGVPITVVTMAIYEDSASRRFLDSSLDASASSVVTPTVRMGCPPVGVRRTRTAFQVSVADLIGAGLLEVGEQLEWPRPRSSQTFKCAVQADGRLLLHDGTLVGSLSAAAQHSAGSGSFDGWECWRSIVRGGSTLKNLRAEFLAQQPEAATDEDKYGVSVFGVD